MCMILLMGQDLEAVWVLTFRLRRIPTRTKLAGLISAIVTSTLIINIVQKKQILY